MASLIPGFEYDIFISYRHKDNKGEHWVTEFVNALRTELESTFKEDISIYFDENPHDGLHEHYDVDESLRTKLNCLVFIPIVSRTYCDPNSFAWKFELIAFMERAKADQFGLKVKFPNGNVASRVLPIRIHELEKPDTTLFESVTVGVFRPIDFVYKTTGVNRPLRNNDEHSPEGKGHILYRDQVNKVANAIKELISTMRTPAGSLEKARGPTVSNSATRRPILRYGIVAALLIALIAIGYYAFNVGATTLNASSSSIAIIPFRNNTGDETKNYYGVGIASEVSTKMGLTKQFDFVSSLQATMQYQQANDPPVKIGKELAVTHILSGMYQTAGDNIQVTVELIEANTGKVLWNLPYRTRYNDIFELQANIATRVMDKFSIANLPSEEVPTKNLDAYYHNRKGVEIIGRASAMSNYAMALPEFHMAIQLDSGYLDPWGGIIWVLGFGIINGDDTLKVSGVKPYMDYVNGHFPESWRKLGIAANYRYWVLKDYDGALEMYSRVLAENPEAYNVAGAIYRRKLMLDEATSNTQKLIRQTPSMVGNWNELYNEIRSNGNTEDVLRVAEKIYQLNNNQGGFLYNVRQRQGRLAELPDDIKEKRGLQYLGDLHFQNRDYQKLLSMLANDSAWKGNQRIYRKALVHYLLHNDDSAMFYAKRFEKKDANSDQIIEMLGILKNEKEGDDFLNADYANLNLDADLEGQWFLKSQKLTFFVMSQQYEKATTSLKEMNRDYPQIGFYDWLNVPTYHRIKKEYTPFQEAINQLKYPPKIKLSEQLPW